MRKKYLRIILEWLWFRRKSNRESARRSRVRKLEETQESETAIATLQNSVTAQAKMLSVATEHLETMKLCLSQQEQRVGTLCEGVRCPYVHKFCFSVPMGAIHHLNMSLAARPRSHIPARSHFCPSLYAISCATHLTISDHIKRCMTSKCKSRRKLCCCADFQAAHHHQHRGVHGPRQLPRGKASRGHA